MGRGGGGGGSHGGSHGGGGFHGSSHSFGGGRSGGRSFGGGRSSGPSFGSGPRYSAGPRFHRGSNVYVQNNYGPGYGGGAPYRGSGCGGIIVPLFVVIILAIVLFFLVANGFSYTSTSYIKEDVLEQEAKTLYNEKFNDSSVAALLLISAVNKDADTEQDYLIFDKRAAVILDDYQDLFWDLYDNYYNDDVGKQVADALNELTDRIKSEKVEKLDGQKYRSDCYDDGMNWMDSTSGLKSAIKEFYEVTGIQFYVVTEDYKDYVGDYEKQTSTATQIVKVLIIAIAVVAVIVILFKWWKAKKKQKNIEDENAIKILNTPLESFGDSDLSKTMDKYDDK